MPKTKKKEDILARKRELEKRRYEMIKNNPELYAKYKEKNKAKYEKRKKEGKVVSINSLTPRDQKMLRKKWREDAKKSYQRKKEKQEKIKLFIECNSPPYSDIENTNIDNVVDCHREYEVKGAQGNPECRRITRSRELSPATSQGSSVSSGIGSPNAQRLLRKLRYKKDKEIASLRLKLKSVMKLNDVYRKKVSRSRQPLQEKRNLSIAFEKSSLGDNIQLENSVVQIPRDALLEDGVFMTPGTSIAEESVTALHRSTPFSALSEMELPPELQRSTLDKILNEGPVNVTESSLNTFKHGIDTDSDSDYDIF